MLHVLMHEGCMSVHVLTSEACLQPGINPYDAQSTDVLHNSSAMEPLSPGASSHHAPAQVPTGGFTYSASGDSRYSDQLPGMPLGTYINNGTYIPQRDGALNNSKSDPRNVLGGPNAKAAPRGYGGAVTAGRSGLGQPPTVTRATVQAANGRNGSAGGFQGPAQQVDWLTADPRTSAAAAPAVADQLGSELDSLAKSGKPFLGRFLLLTSTHRRLGGQGVVQVRSPQSAFERYLF
jgi:hypothetical protein